MKKLASLLAVAFIAMAANSQNITTATNGLNKPTTTSVGLGGTLTGNTTVDLGATFTFGLGKSTSKYFFVDNAGNIGIGNGVPSTKLDVSGGIAATAFTLSTGAGNGKILTSNASGIASWQTPGFWKLSGNSATSPGTDFIGTTDAQDLVFKTNNLQKMRLSLTGRLGIYNSLHNIFVGEDAGNEAVTGMDNVSVGVGTLLNTTSGIDNLAMGAWALTTNTTGRDNSALGTSSMLVNTTGIRNVAIGSLSMFTNTTGNDNTVAGTLGLYSNTTGAGNTVIGYYAGVTNTTGNYNSVFGYGADVSSANLSNATALGFNSKVSASNSFVLGGTGADIVNVGIGVTAPSSRLEINSATSGASGLKLTQLTSSSATTSANGKALTVDASGNVILVPASAITADGSETKVSAGTNISVSGTGTTANPYVVSTSGSFYWTNSALGTGNIVNSNAGGVIIGTGITSVPASYKLYVSGGILTEKLKTTLKTSANWSDHVFDKNYKLMSLDSVEAFILQNKHLPRVPSADQLVEEGLEMNKMFATQMEKIEELTLYLIEMRKENARLSAELEKIKQTLSEKK